MMVQGEQLTKKSQRMVQVGGCIIPIDDDDDDDDDEEEEEEEDGSTGLPFLLHKFEG